MENRRKFLKKSGGLGIAALSLTLAGCVGGDEGEYPDGTITAVNGFSEGGGVDTNFRQVQSYWEEEIGTNFTQDYQPGANTRISVDNVLENHNDCYGFGIVMNETAAAIAIDENDPNTEPGFAIDELEFIGTLSNEATILRIQDDEDRFHSLEELIEYSEDNPGEVNVGAPGADGRNMLANIFIMDEFDLDWNLVPYDGGGPTQTALLQGEIDVACRGVYNSLAIADESTCIGIFAEDNIWGDITDDAPPVNEALGTDFPYAPTFGIQTYYLPMEAAEEYPDRYQTLVDTFEQAMENEEYHEELEEIDPMEPLKLDYHTPSETRELWEDTANQFSDVVHLFEEYVQQ